MANRIIILDQTSNGRFRYALWADVPAGRESFYADPNKKSAWVGASAADNAALQAGTITEFVDEDASPVGLKGVAAIQPQLEKNWQEFQDRVNAYNPWVAYGTTWDGSKWSSAGVAAVVKI